MKQPLIISVILNTNKRDDTLACVSSLEQSDYQNHAIMVLDNASTDGSVEALHAQFPKVQVLSLAKNAGYTGNNNVGIAAAMEQGADWVFVLNEDTILDPNCLKELIRVAESDPQIGIVGPMVYHFDEPTVIQSAGGLFGPAWEAQHRGQNEPDLHQYPQPTDVRWISGCAILVRRAVIEQIGGLDERFFYYWEEVEWCVRAAARGWRLVHVPEAKIWHKGVQRDYQPKPSVSYYNTRNRLLLLAKHHAPLKVWIGTWSQVLRTLTSYSIRPKWRHKRAHRDAQWHGMIDFLRRRWGQAQL